MTDAVQGSSTSLNLSDTFIHSVSDTCPQTRAISRTRFLNTLSLMSDHLQRISSPLSSSPGRSSSLSRPHFPWTTYTHRSSTSSLASGHSTPVLSQPSYESRTSNLPGVSHAAWPPNSHSIGSNMALNAASEGTTRQWSFFVRFIIMILHLVLNDCKRDSNGSYAT
jgi:hypothetical protein